MLDHPIPCSLCEKKKNFGRLLARLDFDLAAHLDLENFFFSLFLPPSPRGQRFWHNISTFFVSFDSSAFFFYSTAISQPPSFTCSFRFWLPPPFSPSVGPINSYIWHGSFLRFCFVFQQAIFKTIFFRCSLFSKMMLTENQRSALESSTIFTLSSSGCQCRCGVPIVVLWH